MWGLPDVYGLLLFFVTCVINAHNGAVFCVCMLVLCVSTLQLARPSILCGQRTTACLGLVCVFRVFHGVFCDCVVWCYVIVQYRSRNRNIVITFSFWRARVFACSCCSRRAGVMTD